MVDLSSRIDDFSKKILQLSKNHHSKDGIDSWEGLSNAEVDNHVRKVQDDFHTTYVLSGKASKNFIDIVKNTPKYEFMDAKSSYVSMDELEDRIKKNGTN